MIKFDNIEIKYGDFVAIKNLNMEINRGEFFTFLGPSGCGKTTVLRSLVGFVTPSSGKLIVDNTDITNFPVETRKIGIVFQSYALFPTMSVYDNIAFGLNVKKLSSKEISEKVKEVSKKVEISDTQLLKGVDELSGGQQQRVALARAIILEPQILCLDEPLSNLDAKLRVGLRDELKRLQKNLGITTLYVTHDQEEALTLSDRIAVFNNGYVEQIGTPFEIYNHSKSEFVCDFIGDINRLKARIINEINLQASSNFSPNCDAFIRLERTKLYKSEESSVSIKGVVIDREYNGMVVKYTIESYGQIIKCVEMNDKSKFHNVGDEVNFYINISDIMQYVS